MAQALFDAGKFEEALAAASAADGDDAIIVKGMALLRLGRVDESIAEFDRLPASEIAKANRNAAVRTKVHLAVEAADALFRKGDAAAAAGAYGAIESLMTNADEDVQFQVERAAIARDPEMRCSVERARERARERLRARERASENARERERARARALSPRVAKRARAL